ncbi:hypothetical protein SAMN05444955_1161 [Lihuaxuella thermophila]|uniref:Uncharacterized protein n=1 Tax=Lihuaxuella thermophila TaxID=1173111 RepID=A0A1H8I3I4_9BACL|nr:hypothetical protein SAMN05444955_1161 [Lihuaxuella thermophila]
MVAGVVCLFIPGAQGVGVSILLGWGLSFGLSILFNGGKIDKSTFLEAAIGGILGAVSFGVGGVLTKVASSIGKKIITAIGSSPITRRVIGSLVSGGKNILTKVPGPIRGILSKVATKGGVFGAVDGVVTSIADDWLRGKKIDWKKALASGLVGTLTFGIFAYAGPAIAQQANKIPIVKTVTAKIESVAGKWFKPNSACACNLKYTTSKTQKHVHEGETVTDPQSPYNGKWSGGGLHNWRKMKERVKQDGYYFNKVEKDQNGVLNVEVRRVGYDPKTLNKYENIKKALETLQSGNASKKQQKKAQKLLQQNNIDPNTDPNSIDPKTLARKEQVISKTVYPSHYTEQQIDEMGEKALDQYLQSHKLQYSTLPNGDVEPIKFNAVVKGPDGKNIEVEGYVVPKPDGTVDYIDILTP